MLHPQGIAVHILIWDPGIGVLGSSSFDGVEFRVEWLLGELTEILWPLIILLIRSMWVSCVVSTWRDHILRGVYLVSHRWIWDPGTICSGFSYCLRTSNISAGRTVMSPFWDIIRLQHFRVLCLPKYPNRGEREFDRY